MPRYAYKPILDTKVKAVKLEPYVVDQNEDTNIDSITESGIHYVSGKNVKGLYRPHSLQKLVGQLWVMFNAQSACVTGVGNTVVIEYAMDDSKEWTEVNEFCDLIYNIAKDWQSKFNAQSACVTGVGNTVVIEYAMDDSKEWTEVNEFCDLIYNIAKDWQSNDNGETVQEKWLLDMSGEDSEDGYAEDDEDDEDEWTDEDDDTDDPDEDDEDDVDPEQVKEDLLNDFKETIMNTLNKYGVSHEDIENVDIVKTPYGFGLAISGSKDLKKPEVKEEENEEKDFMDALRALLLNK